jgi:hypothetical protein
MQKKEDSLLAQLQLEINILPGSLEESLNLQEQERRSFSISR